MISAHHFEQNARLVKSFTPKFRGRPRLAVFHSFVCILGLVPKVPYAKPIQASLIVAEDSENFAIMNPHEDIESDEEDISLSTSTPAKRHAILEDVQKQLIPNREISQARVALSANPAAQATPFRLPDLPPKVLNKLNDYYNSYTKKDEVDLSDLNTEKGKNFARKAFGDMRFQTSELGMSEEDSCKMDDVYKELCKQTNPVIVLGEIHEQILETVQSLANAKTPEQIEQIADDKSIKHEDLWTQWQQTGESLKRDQGHKVIYEQWPITMQELSNLHRDVETLNLLLQRLYDRENGNHISATGTHVKAIIDSGVLEKVSKPASYHEREDIPLDPSEYAKQWRQLRTVEGSRDKDVLKTLLNPSTESNLGNTITRTKTTQVTNIADLELTKTKLAEQPQSESSESIVEDIASPVEMQTQTRQTAQEKNTVPQNWNDIPKAQRSAVTTELNSDFLKQRAPRAAKIVATKFRYLFDPEKKNEQLSQVKSDYLKTIPTQKLSAALERGAAKENAPKGRGGRK
jgi:hypothetical protein